MLEKSCIPTEALTSSISWEKASYSLGSYINTIYEYDKEKIKQITSNSDAAYEFLVLCVPDDSSY